MMSFLTFQSTRQWSDNIPDAIRADMGGPAKGNLYLGSLYIEQTDEWSAATKRGKWYLLIDRREWFSDDLRELELRLWAWALEEGYTTEVADTEQSLCDEYDGWVKVQGLPDMSADDLLNEDITDSQRRYLMAFNKRWRFTMRERDQEWAP